MCVGLSVGTGVGGFLHEPTYVYQGRSEGV